MNDESAYRSYSRDFEKKVDAKEDDDEEDVGDSPPYVLRDFGNSLPAEKHVNLFLCCVAFTGDLAGELSSVSE
jgi:hypothetical protein